MINKECAVIFVFVFWVSLASIPFAAWLTHVITCLANGEWGFLIAGALFFPVAIIHGIGIWFGVWH